LTEDEENLRKFLESDDPALVTMGLSMAKGAGVEVTAEDLENSLKHENIEVVKIGFAFAVENGIGYEAMEVVIDGDWWNPTRLGEIGEPAVKPLFEALEVGSEEHDVLIMALVEIGNVEAICDALEKYRHGLDWEACSHYMEVLAETGHPRALELLVNGTLNYRFKSKDSSYYHQASCVAMWCHEASDIVDSTEYLYAVDFVLEKGLGLLWEQRVIWIDDPWPFPIGDKVTATIIKVLEKGEGDWPDIIIRILGEIGDKKAIEPITKFLETEKAKAEKAQTEKRYNVHWKSYLDTIQAAGKEALEKLV